MTKEKLLMICIGTYLGLCIGTFVGLTECHKPHKEEIGWFKYYLVVDFDKQGLPYKIYDVNGEPLGEIKASDLDRIIH